MKNVIYLSVLILIGFKCFAQDQDTLLASIQTQLAKHEVKILEKLEKLNLENIKSLDGDSLSFVPVNNVGFSCGVIISNTEIPKILYTVQFSKDTEEWIPIEGESIKKRYWGVSL
jgi:hypothetical protein